jgi:hypothetical protein
MRGGATDTHLLGLVFTAARGGKGCGSAQPSLNTLQQQHTVLFVWDYNLFRLYNLTYVLIDLKD